MARKPLENFSSLDVHLIPSYLLFKKHMLHVLFQIPLLSCQPNLFLSFSLAVVTDNLQIKSKQGQLSSWKLSLTSKGDKAAPLAIKQTKFQLTPTEPICLLLAPHNLVAMKVEALKALQEKTKIRKSRRKGKTHACKIQTST